MALLEVGDEAGRGQGQAAPHDRVHGPNGHRPAAKENSH
jgi:hypothetical protein